MGSLRRGFSLLEIIVSVFIVSILLLLLQAVGQSGALVRTAKNQGIALSIVRSELETLREGGYDALPESGPFSSDLLSDLPNATAERLTSAYDEETKQVVVTVAWQDPAATASSTVSLSTLITRIGGLP